MISCQEPRKDLVTRMQSKPLTRNRQTTSTMITKEWCRHTSHLQVTMITMSTHVARSLLVQQHGMMCNGHVLFPRGISTKSPHRWHSWMLISPPAKTSLWLRSSSTRTVTRNRRGRRAGHQQKRKQQVTKEPTEIPTPFPRVQALSKRLERGTPVQQRTAEQQPKSRL